MKFDEVQVQVAKVIFQLGSNQIGHFYIISNYTTTLALEATEASTVVAASATAAATGSSDEKDVYSRLLVMAL